MTRCVALMLALLLAACADWPVVETPPASRGASGWPDLIPIASLPQPVDTASEEMASEQVLARAAALRARAALLRRPVPDQDAFERLRARMAR